MRQMFRVQFCSDGEVVERIDVYVSNMEAALRDALIEAERMEYLEYDEVRILTPYRVGHLQNEQLEKETA